MRNFMNPPPLKKIKVQVNNEVSLKPAKIANGAAFFTIEEAITFY